MSTEFFIFMFASTLLSVVAMGSKSHGSIVLRVSRNGIYFSKSSELPKIDQAKDKDGELLPPSLDSTCQRN
jgi:hypothetical protein